MPTVSHRLSRRPEGAADHAGPAYLASELERQPRDATSSVDLHDPAARARVEAALRELPGVLAARLVAGFERPVDELHVLATLDKSPKTLVRDLQSLLIARFDVATDHRVISIVQLDETTGPLRRARAEIQGVTSSQQGLASVVDVRLSFEDHELVGRAEGPSSASGRRRTAARAALDAIAALLGAARVAEIEGVAVEHLLGHTMAVTFVQIHTSKGTETLCGSALVRQDEAEAVARSVLDAVNREIAHVGG